MSSRSSKSPLSPDMPRAARESLRYILVVNLLAVTPFISDEWFRLVGRTATNLDQIFQVGLYFRCQNRIVVAGPLRDYTLGFLDGPSFRGLLAIAQDFSGEILFLLWPFLSFRNFAAARSGDCFARLRKRFRSKTYDSASAREYCLLFGRGRSVVQCSLTCLL